MGEKVVYLLFTNTGTVLAKTIRLFTNQPLNHVSISPDQQLEDVYSFGRKNERNPFIGGFVKENIRSEFLRNSQCEIYQLKITNSDFQRIIQRVYEMEATKDNYKYNFIGLFGVLLQVELNRRNAFFCSQFIASLLNEVQHIKFEKSICFVKPEDIKKLSGLELVYTGTLEGYFTGELMEEKRWHPIFLPIYLTKKLKQFVLK